MKIFVVIALSVTIYCAVSAKPLEHQRSGQSGRRENYCIDSLECPQSDNMGDSWKCFKEQYQKVYNSQKEECCGNCIFVNNWKIVKENSDKESLCRNSDEAIYNSNTTFETCLNENTRQNSKCNGCFSL